MASLPLLGTRTGRRTGTSCVERSDMERDPRLVFGRLEHEHEHDYMTTLLITYHAEY